MPTTLEHLRIAIVSDQLATAGGLGGAERCVLALHELFPAAPVFTTVFHPERMGPAFAQVDVRPSWVDRIPGARSRHAAFLPLMPLASESFDLRDFDLIVSSHHSVAHGALTRSDATHISYCHSPMRYGWDLTHSYLDTLGPVARAGASVVLSALRTWDAAASLRVDQYVANSEHVARRIWKTYRREAEVVHPPVELRSAPADPSLGTFFLVVSRLVPYKRVDLAIAACNRLRIPLVIIGEGPELPKLKAQAGPTVTFLGRQPDTVVTRYMASCQALLFPGLEDFGMTPVEVMAAGRPVIAFKAGGALETVRHGETGLFFAAQDVTEVVAAMEALLAARWDPDVCREQARRFGPDRFKQRFLGIVKDRVKYGARAQSFSPALEIASWLPPGRVVGDIPGSRPPEAMKR